ncbi:oligosaccharide flippase family protein [bacterium]|nr:oligosaccharide flippase family protein [bacterium]
MLIHLKKTFKHSVIYSLGNLSTKLIGIVLLPLYTSHLTLEEYGMLGILEATSLVLISVLSFRLPTAMIRWCSDESDLHTQKVIVFNTLFFCVLSLIVINCILMPLKNACSQLFFGQPHYDRYFLYLFIFISFEILNQVFLGFLRFKEKSFVYIVLTVVKMLTILAFNIYFVAYMNMGVEGIILGQCIGAILFLLVSFPYLISNMTMKINFYIFKEMFYYGFPLVFSTISGMILSLGDRYILPYFHGYSDLGVYSLAYKVASVINVFILNSFTLGFLPIAFKMYNKPESERFFSKMLTYFVFILLVSVLLLSLFSRELIETFALKQSYWKAAPLIPFIAFVFVFKGMQYIFALGFHYVKKTKYNAMITLSGAVLNLILNLLLIPKLHVYGAIIATLISAFIMTGLVYYYSQKFYFIRYESVKIFKMFVVMVLLFSASYCIHPLGSTLRILIKVTLVFLFPILLYFWKFYEQIELLRLKQFYQRCLHFFQSRE